MHPREAVLSREALIITHKLAKRRAPQCILFLSHSTPCCQKHRPGLQFVYHFLLPSSPSEAAANTASSSSRGTYHVQPSLSPQKSAPRMDQCRHQTAHLLPAVCTPCGQKEREFAFSDHQSPPPPAATVAYIKSCSQTHQGSAFSMSQMPEGRKEGGNKGETHARK